jgi:hypothetical protein
MRSSNTRKLTVLDGDVRSASDLRFIAEFVPDTIFHMAAWLRMSILLADLERPTGC